MKRFENILLVSDPYNPDEMALERAVSLAKTNQAQLTVAEVMEDSSRYRNMRLLGFTPQEIEEVILKEHLARLEKLQQFVARIEQKAEFQVTTEVLVGTSFLTIIQKVLREKHDLVISTAQGNLFGSMSMQLMRKCPCPVWVIKATQGTRYSQILAAVDPDPSDEQRTALNTKIVALAASLALLEKAKLHLVHVSPPQAEKRIGSHARIRKDDVGKWLREAEDARKKHLDELLEAQSVAELDLEIRLPKGYPGTVIPAIAKEKQIDLIVMGTVCRTGMAGFFIGNTAEEILQKVDCSVLTVKPDAFVTPVKLDEP